MLLHGLGVVPPDGRGHRRLLHVPPKPLDVQALVSGQVEQRPHLVERDAALAAMPRRAMAAQKRLNNRLALRYMVWLEDEVSLFLDE